MPCHSEVKKRTWKKIMQTLGRSQVTDSSEMLLTVLFSPPRMTSLRRRPLGGADGGTDRGLSLQAFRLSAHGSTSGVSLQVGGVRC